MPLREDILSLIENDNALAQRLLRDLTEQMPRSFDAWRLRGASHERRFEFEPALACYDQALKLQPNDPEVLQSIALIRLNQGDDQVSLDAHEALLAISPGAHSMRMRALLLHRMGRLAESIAVYQQLLAGAQPNSPSIIPALDGLARVLADAGQPLAADQAMRQLLTRFQAAPALVASSIVSANTAADFLEWTPLTDKGHLTRFLNRRLAADPIDSGVPEAFVLPQDREALLAFMARPNAPSLLIVKPIRSSGGQGIHVVANVSEVIDRTDVVIQRYIDRPFLIDGCKGHIRVYGLITSASPLRAYVFGDGLVRLAPDPYDPDPAKAADVSRHVTNTALHAGHPGIVISQDANQEDVGTVRTLSALLARLSAAGIDGGKTFERIAQLVGWFVRQLDADGLFQRQAAAAPKRAFGPKLFGLDILVDEAGQPWLLEMQRAPATRGAPLVERISTEVFGNVFRMSHGMVIEDGMSAETIARLVTDPAAREARELEIETRNPGRFRRLQLS